MTESSEFIHHHGQEVVREFGVTELVAGDLVKIAGEWVHLDGDPRLTDDGNSVQAVTLDNKLVEWDADDVVEILIDADEDTED